MTTTDLVSTSCCTTTTPAPGRPAGEVWEIWARPDALLEPQIACVTDNKISSWDRLKLTWEQRQDHPGLRLFPARVVVGGTPGEVQIDSEEIPAEIRAALAKGWTRELREEGHWWRWQKGQKLTRFLTRDYAAVEEDEARRLVEIDKGGIEVSPDVELIHVGAGDNWALWSDGRITTAIGLPRHCRLAKGLSKDASRLIGDARGSDSGAPKEIGGYAFLSQVAEITSEETVARGGDRGRYARETLTKIGLKMLDGSHTSIVVFTVGYSEGYAWEAYPSVEAFEEEQRKAAKLLEEQRAREMGLLEE